MNPCVRFLIGAALTVFASRSSAQIIRVDFTSPTNESAISYNPGAAPASAAATLQTGTVVVNLTSGGDKYSNPTVSVNTTGTGVASAVASVTFFANGAIASIALNPSTGYTALPTLTISDPTGSGAQASVAFAAGSGPAGQVKLALVDGGSGYKTAPSVTLLGGGGSGANFTTSIDANGAVTGFSPTTSGTGYTSTPTVLIAAPPGIFTVAARVTGVPSSDQATTTFSVNGNTISRAITGNNPATTWNPSAPGSYFITATTTDQFGNAAPLATLRVFVTGAKVFSPIAHTALPLGSSVVISGDGEVGSTASNPFTGQTVFTPGFIKSIVFDVFDATGAKISSQSATAAPYSVRYTPPGIGFYKIVATATDNNGQTYSSSNDLVDIQVVAPIGTPPKVTIANPVDGGSTAAGSAVKIIADAGWASDEPNPGKVNRVEFYIDGVLLSQATAFPFTASWTPVVPGRYTLVALAYDDKGNVPTSAPTTVTVTGGLPSVKLTSPATGTTVVQGTKLSVAVTAGGSDGGITTLKTIDFLVDGNLSDSLPKGTDANGNPLPLTQPFTFTWPSNVALGTHRLSARVTDANGLIITSPEVAVTVVENKLPEVSLSSPAAGTSSPVNVPVQIVASARDSDGQVVSVEFFVNGLSIGSPVTATPFQISWTPTAAGAYSLTAKATDNAGGTATSAPVSITIDPAASSVSGGASSSSSIFRGDYGSPTESGHFAFGVNRNNRGTFIAFSTAPVGPTYFWSDIIVGSDGTFSVRDTAGKLLLSGQVSATGVTGQFGANVFVGPITMGSSASSSLFVSGPLTGNPGSNVVALVGSDGSVTIYSSAGGKVETGTDFVTSSGGYTIGTPTGGRITGTVTDSAGIVSGTVTGGVSGSFLLRQAAGRLTNMSARTLAGVGDRTLVAGFIVRGTGTKPVLMRAVGPTLVNFGVTNPDPTPSLALVAGSGAGLASNNGWNNNAALANLAAQVGAFALNANSSDSALQFALPAPGTYSAVVGGTASPGSALFEIYDTENANAGTARLANLSVRGVLGSGETIIAGFVISGDERKKLLIRAVGPSLASFGVINALADPKLTLAFGSTTLASNDDWSASSDVATTTSAVGAFPLTSGSKDSVIVAQLNPGAYTVQVTGAGNATGVVLVELYDADP